MNTKYPLAEFIDLMVSKSDYSKKEIEPFVKAFFSLLEEALLEDKLVKIKGIGTFKLLPVEKRKSVNVQTGEAVEIPAHYKVTFQPDKELNDQVNGILALFESIEISEEQANRIENKIGTKKTTEGKTSENESEVSNATQQTEKETELAQTTINTDTKHDEVVIDQSEQQTAPVTKTIPTDTPSTHNQGENKKETSPKKSSSASGKSYMWVYIVAFVSLLVMAGLFYSIRNQIGNFESMETEKAVAEKPLVPISEAITVTDEDEPDSTAVSTDALSEPVSAPIETQQPTQQSTPLKVTIKPGERLTIIAERYYGHKAFWGYIYDENRSRLPNPNNVPVGVEITIPTKQKYNIDANNPESIQKAKTHSEEILRQFEKN